MISSAAYLLQADTANAALGSFSRGGELARRRCGCGGGRRKSESLAEPDTSSEFRTRTMMSKSPRWYKSIGVDSCLSKACFISGNKGEVQFASLARKRNSAVLLVVGRGFRAKP